MQAQQQKSAPLYYPFSQLPATILSRSPMRTNNAAISTQYASS